MCREKENTNRALYLDSPEGVVLDSRPVSDHSRVDGCVPDIPERGCGGVAEWLVPLTCA